MKTTIVLISLIMGSFFATALYAQKVTPWVINDVPPNEVNNRFYNDIVSVNRPALSIVGFDNSNDHANGFGLKQILNQAYVSEININEQKKMILDILDIARDDDIILNPTSIEDYRENSNILQYRAFEVLASYVLEQNGVNPNSFGICRIRSQSDLHQF